MRLEKEKKVNNTRRRKWQTYSGRVLSCLTAFALALSCLTTFALQSNISHITGNTHKNNFDIIPCILIFVKTEGRGVGISRGNCRIHCCQNKTSEMKLVSKKSKNRNNRTPETETAERSLKACNLGDGVVYTRFFFAGVGFSTISLSQKKKIKIRLRNVTIRQHTSRNRTKQQQSQVRAYA